MSLDAIRARNAALRAAGNLPGAVGAPVLNRNPGSRDSISLPLAPCAHGGTDADITERCPSCSGGARHVRECEVHGSCTWAPVNPALMNCARCRREGLGYEPERAGAD